MNRKERIINKAEGVILFILGAALVLFIYNFDNVIMHRPVEFGTKAVIGFIVGGITIVNGIRIYRRK